jgi:predicted dehydrogenase
VLRLSRGSFQPRKPTDNFASRETRAGASAKPRPDNWYVDEVRSGGLVLDLMIHDLDFARWVAGEVDTVYAKRVRPPGRALPGDGIQHAFAILRHHSGALSHVEASWAYPPPVFRTSAEIAGATGLLEFDSEASAPVRMYVHATGDAGDVGLPRSPLHEPPHTTQIRHFVEVLRGNAEPVVTAHDGLAALRLATAAAESIVAGQPVALRDPSDGVTP